MRALVAAEAVPADQTLDGTFLGTYCLNVLSAADRIANWLHGL